MQADAQADAGYRAALMEACKRDPVLFFNAFLWTYDPRTQLKHIPFVTYPFQDAYIYQVADHIERQEDLLTEKSRDMGASWMMLGVFFWRWRFHRDHFLLGSRKEELVDKRGNLDSLFERVRYFIQYMPTWAMPSGWDPKYHDAHMKLFNPEFGNAIIGEATNDNFSRQGRYRAILADEFAFVEHAEAVWRSMGDSTKCRMPISTPNGKNNFFGVLRFSGQIKVSTLHWRLHPLKDDKWYAAEAARRTAQDLAREVDISYEVQAGKPFYGKDYVVEGPLTHWRELVWYQGHELLVGWDYGYHRPAMVITQLDDMDRWHWLYAIMGSDCQLSEFRDHCIACLRVLFPGSPARHFGDHAGNQKSDKSTLTSVEIMAEGGIIVVSRPSNEAEASYASRKKIIGGRLKQYPNGAPALAIDKSRALLLPPGIKPREGFVYGTQILHDAMRGGYAYPPQKENQPEKEEPHKDGYYDHTMNAVEYIGINHLVAPKDESMGFAPDLEHMMAGGRGGY